MPARTVVGASVNCYVNGALYGQVKSFRWSPTTPHREAHGIDSVEPYDLIPMACSVQGSLALWRTRLDGGAQGIGAGFIWADLPRGKFFTIHLKETLTQTLLFEASYCSVIGESWGADAQRPMEGSLTFKGLGWGNEIHRPDQG